jgi:peptide/nickel transport system permease protein
MPELPVIGKLPLGGMKSVDYDTLCATEKFFDVLKHLLVPGIVLATASMAGLQRIMRGNMLEELRQRYITTARAKGLGENKVIYKHALRNAINPLITIFGYEFSALLSGAALTEIITGYPGLGAVMLEAVRAQDQFLVMGDMLMSGALLITGNLIADILLSICDPRVKLS